MALALSFDASRLRTSQRVTLDGVPVVVDLQWLPRLRGWYADVYAADGRLLAAGRRVEPGAASVLPDLTLPGAPPGLVTVEGDGAVYVPSGLGSLVQVVYAERADLGG